MATSITSRGANCKRKPCLKYHWTHAEDDLLIRLVHIHGPQKWDQIAAHIHGRTGKSCRIRWMNQLNPRVDKTPFSAEEKQRLLELHRQYGNRWSTIASYFPGRTDNQVKNEYHTLVGSRYMRGWGSSSSIDSHGPLKKGSGGLPTVPVGVCFPRTNYCGSAPSFSAMPDTIGMGPSLVGGSSSVYGKGEFWRAANSSAVTSLGPRSFDGVGLTSIRPHKRSSHGSSMISDANSAEPSSVPQPQQGVGVKDNQFIDFLGVGSSD